MKISFHTRVRPAVAVLVATAALAGVTAGSSLAATHPSRPAASYYTKEQLQAMGQRWAVSGALSKLTPQERAILAQAWMSNTAPLRTTSSGNFAWGVFGIGAGAMLCLVLLVGGVAVGGGYGRRPSMRARPAS